MAKKKSRRRSYPWLAAFPTLFVLLAVALALRSAASTIPGYGQDLGFNAGWAHSGVRLGLGNSYREQLYDNILPDHPPLSIISYTAVGQLYLNHVDPSEDTSLLANSVWIRLPAIVADLVILVVLFLLVREKRGFLAASIVGLAVAASPVIIADSAVWGQIDSLFTMWIVLALYCRHRGWIAAFAACFTLALLSKVQAIALAPLMAYLFFSRVPLQRQIHAVGASAAVSLVVLLPFMLAGTLPEVFSAYTGAVGRYESLSLNAFNLWWLLYPNDTDRASTEAALWIFTYRQIGLALFTGFAAAFLTAYHRWWKAAKLQHPDVDHLFAIAAATFYAFFVFNTEMHERYLYPAAVLSLPLMVRSWKFALSAAAINVLSWLNIGGVIAIFPMDRWLFETFGNLRQLVAFATVFLFFPYQKAIVGLFSRPAQQEVSPSSQKRKKVAKARVA